MVPGASPRAASEIHVASQRQSIAIRHRDSTAAIAGSVNMCAAAGRGVGVARAELVARAACYRRYTRRRCFAYAEKSEVSDAKRETKKYRSVRRREELLDINARGNGR